MFKTHSPKTVTTKLSNLKPLNYNRFRWWRLYDTYTKSLPKRSKLIDKIRNGDFDFSHYFWQIQQVEIELNQLKEESIDSGHYMEQSRMTRARRQRLIDDFEKDENNKLLQLIEEFTKHFNITIETYYEELELFCGDIEEFYYHCNEKFIETN
tara:strand:- start:3551 stop:4009 length:459 start_codon:yes stop_codon:yes gene_type:complete